MRARLLVAVLLALGCGGCWQAADEPAATGGAYLLLPETACVPRWHERALQGLQRVGEESAKPTESILFDGEEGLRGALRNLGTAEADIVFCLCPDAGHVVFAEAVAAPGTEYVVLGGATHTGNVSGVVFRLDEAAQLAGALAAAVAGPLPIGVLSGPVRQTWWEGVEEAFIRGVANADSDSVVIRGDGPFAPEELALAGVKVVFYLADPADPGVLRACHDGEMLVVATDERALSAAPRTVVATFLVDLPEAMARVAAGLREGGPGGRVHSFPLGSGLVDLQLSDRMRVTRNPEVRAALYRARDEIIGGITEIERLGIGR